MACTEAVISSNILSQILDTSTVAPRTVARVRTLLRERVASDIEEPFSMAAILSVQ